jgi:HPr kinase/phosphorylase
MSGAMLIHATAVAIGCDAVLLRGAPGAGKSDLALRMMGLVRPFALVSDDQVHLERHGDALAATAPRTLRGLMEVRGLGIARVPFIETARTRLVIDLVPLGEEPRMPPEGETVELLGVQLPRLRLHAFAASTPLKCALALRDAIYAASRS